MKIDIRGNVEDCLPNELVLRLRNLDEEKVERIFEKVNHMISMDVLDNLEIYFYDVMDF